MIYLPSVGLHLPKARQKRQLQARSRQLIVSGNADAGQQAAQDLQLGSGGEREVGDIQLHAVIDGIVNVRFAVGGEHRDAGKVIQAL